MTAQSHLGLTDQLCDSTGRPGITGGATALTPDGLPETSPWQAGCFTAQVPAPVSRPWTVTCPGSHSVWGRPGIQSWQAVSQI